VYQRYAGASEPDLHDAVTWALSKKALTLIELRRRRDAVGVYRDLTAHRLPNRGARVQAVLALMAVALVSLAVSLRLQGVAGRAELWGHGEFQQRDAQP